MSSHENDCVVNKMSLKKIAALTGVSISTVSRVLSDAPGPCASKEVREKIWHAAQEIGYAPNRAAQSLRKGEQANAAPKIAIVNARIRSFGDDPFFQELFMSVRSELYREGCAYFSCDVTDNGPIVIPKCDGMVILGRCSRDILDKLRRRTPNIVGVWRNPTDFAIDEVMCDGKKAAAMAVDYLISRGRKCIAYIGDCTDESRYDGYRDALARGGMPLDPKLVFETSQTHAEGLEAMRRIIADGSADAVFCANDITAAGALEALAEIPRNRPRIAVISIDNIDLAQQTAPLLTTINIPRGDMAHMAVKVLMDRIAGGHSEIVRVEFPCRLVKRKSCFES